MKREGGGGGMREIREGGKEGLEGEGRGRERVREEEEEREGREE